VITSSTSTCVACGMYEAGRRRKTARKAAAIVNSLVNRGMRGSNRACLPYSAKQIRGKVSLRISSRYAASVSVSTQCARALLVIAYGDSGHPQNHNPGHHPKLRGPQHRWTPAASRRDRSGRYCGMQPAASFVVGHAWYRWRLWLSVCSGNADIILFGPRRGRGARVGAVSRRLPV